MSAIKEYFLQAGLAQAAYGTFSGNTIEAEELTRIGADMSSSQAAAFVEKWQVVAQSPNSSTGLSATVFEEIGSGKRYLAIRGTEPTGSDLTADGLLASGLPSNFNPQFNAPRMGGIVGSFADMLLGFMGLSPTGDSTKISNIEAATGISPIAGLGFDAAPPVDILIEDQTQISGSPPSKNHSQQAFDACSNTQQNLSQNYSFAWRLAA